jgi:hypothetical protein
LINALRKPENEDAGTLGVPDKVFRRLSTKAKFTYCMLYGEDFGQNCDGMPAELSEENKIFAQPSAAFGNEQEWSERQKNFLHSRRSTVIGLLKTTIRTKRRVGVNLKKAILEIDAYELIPILESTYLINRKDLDILSVLSVLMKHKSYKPYLKTATYKTFYTAPNSDYKTSIPYTRKNETLLLDLAKGLYNSYK